MVVLAKLGEVMKERKLSAEAVALLSKGRITGMTVRRAVQGRNIQNASADVISRVLKVDLGKLQ